MRSKNYSHETSKPALIKNPEEKLYQRQMILQVLQSIGGSASILQIQQMLAKDFKQELPQSTVSGRVGQLRDAGKIAYTGTAIYEGLKRRIFSLVTVNSTKKNVHKKVAPKQKESPASLCNTVPRPLQTSFFSN